MPPPMPLPGTDAAYSSGSQSSSASSSAKCGRIDSHASPGEPAAAIAPRTPATNVRTVSVSRTNSSGTTESVRVVVVARFGDLAGDADLVDERVAALLVHDHCGTCGDREPCVAGRDEEPAWILPCGLVLVELEADDLHALRVRALANERHGPQQLRVVGGRLDSLV